MSAPLAREHLAAAPDRLLTLADPLPPCTADELLDLYERMALMRRVEELAAKAYTQRRVLGFCHLYIGQESVATGAAAATSGDYWLAAYREHGHALAKGVPARAIIAELFGRATGASHGQGGSMHIFDRNVDFMGGYGIVGGHVPLANGIAWAARARGEDRVCVCFFGDGAANQGQVYETFNMASLWKLPVVFVIENNQYAMGTSMARGSSTPALYTRGAAFGISGEAVDGMDFDAVKQAGLKALAHCRGGDGPYILEMNTYRYRGHSMSDPAKYRTREEVTKMRDEKDPIEHVRKQLIALGVADEALKEVDKAVKAQVNDAAQFAQESPEPDASALWTDIYASA